MTQDEKIVRLKALLGDESEDEAVMSVYLDMAAAKILERLYPFAEPQIIGGQEVWPEKYSVIPKKYEMLQLKICVYLLNKRGAEGQIQHIENGIHRNYGDSDVPDSMLNDVIPFACAIR